MSPSVPESSFIGLDALSYNWTGNLLRNENFYKAS